MTYEEKITELAERIKSIDFYGIDAEVEEIALDILTESVQVIEFLLDQIEGR